MFLRRLAMALRAQDWTTVVVEFLLVVLGVLLALQVDNWNQERKDRALLDDYLIQLQADLRDDVRRAERRAEFTRELDARADYFRSVIDGSIEGPVDNDLLVGSILTAGYANLTLVNSQTYDELISTGNLRLFQDTDLKRHVVDYYARSESGTQWNNLIQSVQTDYRREIRNLLTAEQYRWARLSTREGGTDAPPMDMDRFDELARGNEDLLGALNAMAEVQLRLRRDSLNTAQYASRLLERLESVTGDRN